MSHVDEGRLHAFLDGALSAADPADAERVELHLAACADCRARIEEAARVRDEASALLGSAQPREFVMPSFDAIRTRASLAGPMLLEYPRRSFLRSPFNDFAWAAMIMLAVGLGWMLNDTLDDETAAPFRLPEMAATDAVDSPRITYIPLPQATTSDAEAGDVAMNAAPSADLRRQAQPTAGAAASQVGAGAGERDVQEYDVVAEEAAAPPALALSDADRRESVEASRAPSVPTREPESVRAAAPSPAPPPPAAAQSAAGADFAAGALAATEEGWRSITIPEAERLTDGKLIRLAGARITSTATRGSGTELEVQTVQLTDRGESIKVVQRRTPQLEARRRDELAAEAERPSAPVMTAGLTVRVEEWTVTLSGAVPPDRLRELAANLS